MPPDIDNPQTYGEFYWNLNVQAQRLRAEEYEKTLSPMAQELIGTIPDLEETPSWLKSFLKQLSEPTEPALDQSQVRFLANLGGGLMNRILGHEIKEFDYALNSYLKNVRIDENTANMLLMRKQIADDFWESRQNMAGYESVEAAFKYESQKPFPSMPEILRYARYHSDPDNPKEKAWELFDFTPKHWDLWWWLSIEKLSTEQVQSIYRRGGFDLREALHELAQLGWPARERTALLQLAYELPNAMLLLQGDLMQDTSPEEITSNVSKAGIHPDYTERYINGVLTKPATQEIINYQLRQDPSLSNLDNELKRIGIHPNYFDTYKTLAYPIPPVQDLITMAVREAFTPEIASRFGQYEGLPDDYVKFAQQKGLTREWAERYWASHWRLPSVNQGFEMLHRGIINQGDLGLLLRALDIMPFWRDKLIQLSFKPLTRVDVRRMHQLGTLDESGIKRAYLDLGYNDYNAGLMTDFTVRFNRRSMSGFNQRDVVSAYINRLIEAGQANAILREIGTPDREIANIMRLSNYKREWRFKNEQIDAIGNLFRKGKMTDSQVRTEFANLGLSAGYVGVLLQQWAAKAEADKTATLTMTQTLKMLTSGLIDEDRARQELRLLGYNEERENLLIQSTKV